MHFGTFSKCFQNLPASLLSGNTMGDKTALRALRCAVAAKGVNNSS